MRWFPEVLSCANMIEHEMIEANDVVSFSTIASGIHILKKGRFRPRI